MDDEQSLLARLEDWARGYDEDEFTGAIGPDYREGFRDAQEVVLGLIQAWTEPAELGRDA